MYYDIGENVIFMALDGFVHVYLINFINVHNLKGILFVIFILVVRITKQFQPGSSLDSLIHTVIVLKCKRHQGIFSSDSCTRDMQINRNEVLVHSY